MSNINKKDKKKGQISKNEAIEMLTDVLLDDILHATDDEIERVMKKLRDDAYMML